MLDPDQLPESSHVDPWAMHLPGQELVPAYLVSRLAAQYRAVVDVPLEAQDDSLTGVAYDEILGRLRGHLVDRVPEDRVDTLLGSEGFGLDARLDQLVGWGVLTRWQEPARSGEDFLRRRDRYQLTPAAARFHAFWTLQTDADDGGAADLTLAPRAIYDRPVTFADAVRERRYPAAAEYQQVMVLHQGMAATARAWQRALAHALSGGPDEGKQEVLWRTLQSYVGMWGAPGTAYRDRRSQRRNAVGEIVSGEILRASYQPSSRGRSTPGPAAVGPSHPKSAGLEESSWSGCSASEVFLRLAFARTSSVVLVLVNGWARSFQPSTKARIFG